MLNDARNAASRFSRSRPNSAPGGTSSSVSTACAKRDHARIGRPERSYNAPIQKFTCGSFGIPKAAESRCRRACFR